MAEVAERSTRPLPMEDSSSTGLSLECATSPVACVPASSPSPSHASVLHALVSDEPVAPAAFAQLLDSVCGEAVAKMQEQQQQQSGSGSGNAPLSEEEQLEAMRQEVSKLQQASSSMLQNMNDIVGQLRNVVNDPALISPKAFQMPPPDSTIPTASPTITTSPSSDGSACQFGHQTPISPFDGVDPSGSGGPALAGAAAPAILACPTRVQLLKERLVKSGLREILIDMTLEPAEAAEADRVAMEEQDKETASMLRAEEARAQIAHADLPADEREVLRVQRRAVRPAMSVSDRVAALNHHSSFPSSLHVTTTSPSNDASGPSRGPLSVPIPVTSPQCNGSRFPGCLSARSASLLSARSPRMQQLVHNEMLRVARELQMEESRQKEQAATSAAGATGTSRVTPGSTSRRGSVIRESEEDDESEGSDSDDSSDEDSDEEDDVAGPADGSGAGKTSPHRSPLPPRHSRSRTSNEAATAAAAAAAAAALEAKERAEAAARVLLDAERLQLERQRLLWESEKLRLQQAHFEELQRAQKVSAEEMQRQAALHADFLANAKATPAAAATATPEQLKSMESKQANFEKMMLQMEVERARMENARLQLDAQLREVQQLKDSVSREPSQPTPVLVQINQSHSHSHAHAHSATFTSPTSSDSNSLHPPSSSGQSSAQQQAEDEHTLMQRNLANYVARRAMKRERAERKALRKERKRLERERSSRPSSRRNSLTGLPMIGSVATAPVDTVTVRGGWHRCKQSIHASGTPSLEGDVLPLGADACVTTRLKNGGSKRNLLAPWTPAELNAPVPLKLFPSQADVLALSPAEVREKTWAVLSAYARYDVAYRAYLDPCGDATTRSIARVHAEASMVSAEALEKARAAPRVVVTPPLFLCLHLSLTDMHKLSGRITRPRPCVEIYSVRSGRPQLVWESGPCAEGNVKNLELPPVVLSLEELCNSGQLERDIIIRVVHVPTTVSASTVSIEAVDRILVGEVWTNLHKLQCMQGENKLPILRPPSKEGKEPKEKGVLLIRQAPQLLVRTNEGLCTYAGNPNRIVQPSSSSASAAAASGSPLTPAPVHARKNSSPLLGSVSLPHASTPPLLEKLPEFSRQGDCTLAFVVSCRSLAGLADRKFAEDVRQGKKKATPAGGRMATFLQFYRQEETGVWSKNPVYQTEEIWPGSTLENAGASSGSRDDPHAPLVWKPIQLKLYDLCFGDVRRKVLVRVMAAPSGMVGAPTLLATFHFQVRNILVREQDPARSSKLLLLDAHATMGNGAAPARFITDVLEPHPPAHRRHSSGSRRHSRSSSISQGVLPATAATAAPAAVALQQLASPASASSHPPLELLSPRNDAGAVGSSSADTQLPCLLFHHAYVYSSLPVLQSLVQRSGIVLPSAADVARAAAAAPDTPDSDRIPFARVVSGLHQIMLDQSRRQGRGADSVIRKLNFADEDEVEPRSSRSESQSSRQRRASSVGVLPPLAQSPAAAQAQSQSQSQSQTQSQARGSPSVTVLQPKPPAPAPTPKDVGAGARTPSPGERKHSSRG